jgi:acetylornithine/succinyldiaminopimelate/putrescine aminotransferase
MNLRDAERRFLAAAAPREDLQPARSEGSLLVDARGRKYVDFLMGWCVGNLGWGNREIRDAVSRFRGPDYVYPAYSYKPWTELAELLAKITPGKLRKSFRATGGTEAVDLALQAAIVHTGRHKFLSIEGSYHGNSIATMSVASSEYRSQYGNLLPGCHKIEPPLDRQAVDRVERRLKKRDVAAFLLEPILINLGVLVPESEFMVGLQKLCRKYGTLLILDEVATGFGRTGTLFASEHFDLEPDILCLGKAMSGGYGGMGAMLATETVARSMEKEGTFYSTYGWHPRSVAAALANIRYILRYQNRLFASLAETSEYFQTRLTQMRFRHAATVRMKGLAIAVEFRKSGYAETVAEKCRKKGLLLASLDDTTLALFPALNIDRKTAQKGLDILQACA